MRKGTSVVGRPGSAKRAIIPFPRPGRRDAVPVANWQWLPLDGGRAEYASRPGGGNLLPAAGRKYPGREPGLTHPSVFLQSRQENRRSLMNLKTIAIASAVGSLLALGGATASAADNAGKD